MMDSSRDEEGEHGEEEGEQHGPRLPYLITVKKYVKQQQAQGEEDDRQNRWDVALVGGLEGGKQKVKEAEMLATIEMTWDEAMAYLKEVVEDYRPHEYVAQNQAREFQKCKTTLQEGEIMVVLDFGMKKTHQHQDALQSDHWSAWQTTLLPMVIYRVKGGKLVLESVIYYSDDLNHSNKFVQKCLTDLAMRYHRQMKEEGHQLRNIILWSDGCAAQFKSRHQMLWIAHQSKEDLKYKGKNGSVLPAPTVEHHFFASCHGKNLCDAMAGLVKSWLMREETRGRYYKDTKALRTFFFSKIDRGKRLEGGIIDDNGKERPNGAPSDGGGGPEDNLDEEMQSTSERIGSAMGEKYGKMRFTIITSVYVAAGVVDHVVRKDAPVVPGIKSHHCFIQHGANEVMTVLYSKLKHFVGLTC